MVVENSGEVFDFADAPTRKILSGGRKLEVYPDGREVLIFPDGTEYLCPSLAEAKKAMYRVRVSIAKAQADRWRIEEDLLGPERFRPTHITI